MRDNARTDAAAAGVDGRASGALPSLGRYFTRREHSVDGRAAFLKGGRAGDVFSWYTYSPTRVRYPYVCGVLLEMYREVKSRLGDPVLAWGEVVGDPERRPRYQSARGKGGLVRATWSEAVELVAAAYVHTTMVALAFTAVLTRRSAVPAEAVSR